MVENILKNKNCFITGTTGGLGVKIVKQLAKQKCNIFLTGRNPNKLQKLKKKLKHFEIKIDYKAGNLAKNEDLTRIIRAARKKFKTIDILINCAGVFPVKDLKNSSPKDFDDCFNVNIRAPVLLTKEFSKDMVKKRWGRIINIGSSSSYEGFPKTSIYCASKHAILGFSRAIHSELRSDNIRTYCISPGSIKTRMGRKVKGQNFETFMDPAEIAEFIVYLISHDKEMVAEEVRLSRTRFE